MTGGRVVNCNALMFDYLWRISAAADAAFPKAKRVFHSLVQYRGTGAVLTDRQGQARLPSIAGCHGRKT